MALQFSSQKSKKTPTRKLKFLPRLALVVDIAGRQFTFKQAPFFEAVAIMKRSEFNLKNFKTISTKILNEISVEPKKERKTSRTKKQ